MKKLKLKSFILLFTLPACASNFEGQMQKVTLRTEPDRYSKCYIYMKEDIKFVSLPTTMDLQRTNKPLNIKCTTADGDAQGETTADVHTNDWGGAKGAVFGLGIGWLYDRLTNAAFDYPSPIIIPLTPKPPTEKKEMP